MSRRRRREICLRNFIATLIGNSRRPRRLRRRRRRCVRARARLSERLKKTRRVVSRCARARKRERERNVGARRERKWCAQRSLSTSARACARKQPRRRSTRGVKRPHLFSSRFTHARARAQANNTAKTTVVARRRARKMLHTAAVGVARRCRSSA